MAKTIIRSPIKKKILILLLGGLALGLTTSPHHQKRVFRQLVWQWNKLNKEKLYRNVSGLEKNKIVRYKKTGEWWNIELTEKGRRIAKEIGLEEIAIKKPKKWDSKWRMILFDVPEKNRVGRDALRNKIKTLGFQELQKSVFVHPYPCKNEIDKIIKFYEIEKFTQQCLVDNLDKNLDKKLKKKFKL